MRNALNNEECIRLIETPAIVLPQTSARRGIFFSNEENKQHIQALYEKWQQQKKTNES